LSEKGGDLFRILTAVILFLLSSPAIANDEQQCLQEAMYFEARSEGKIGMLAVGIVIKNRVISSKYPKTYCSVIRQGRYFNGNPIKDRCQFSYWCDGKKEEPTDQKSWLSAENIAKLVMKNEIIIYGIEDATHYHARYVSPDWSISHKKLAKIGQHIFYEAPRAN
tara:strand:- start:230 stop:724 length:495 start_codon:yes stop_codon:yes gene_type:complete